ncbi:hypothetical protein D3C76_761100 [compost metagenome]
MQRDSQVDYRWHPKFPPPFRWELVLTYAEERREAWAQLRKAWVQLWTTEKATEVDFNGVDEANEVSCWAFVDMMVPSASGEKPINDFGGWLRLVFDNGKDHPPAGLYPKVSKQEGNELACSLTKSEKQAMLEIYPSENLDAPVITFPCTVGELKRLMEHVNKHGLDFPIVPEVFTRVIQEKAARRKGSQSSERQGIELAPYQSRPEMRLEVIRQWFEEQREYEVSDLHVRHRGRKGPRYDCWCWLEKQGLCAPRQLFFSAKMGKTEYTNVFFDAWREFLKEMK